MTTEPVGPSGAPTPTEKKGRKSTPDSEEFKEMMKTEKVGEAEFEKPQKRKFGAQEEPPKLPEPPPKTPPTGPTPFAPPPKLPIPKGGEEVQPPEITLPEELQVTPTEEETEKVEEEKKAKEKKKKEFEEITLPKKEEKKIEGPPIEKKGKIEMPTEKEKNFIKEPAKEVSKAPKKITEKLPFPKEEKEKVSLTKEKKLPEEKEKKEEFKYEVSTVLQEMSPAIAAQTQSLTAALTPYLHPDIIPLFEKMVGTIIQIQTQGITTTQVILNSPAFTSSIFFGSSIILEKYSTAPDSFNIFLRGPQQAVLMFNENLEGLLDAFKRGNFNFKIGRLEAEHERPLFRRKEKPGGKESDSGATR